MRTNTTSVGDVDATVGISDGRVSMTADTETPLAVKWPNHAPLSEDETVVELSLVDDGVRLEVGLNAAALDCLLDALTLARQEVDDVE